MGRKLLILNERDQHHPWAGGAELNVTETAKRLARRGYEPVLLCTRFPGAAREDVQDGMRVRRFGNRFTYYLMLPFIVRQELRRAVRRAGRPGGVVIIEHLNKLPFFTPLYTRVPVLPLAHHLFGPTAFQQVPFPVACVVYVAEKAIPMVYRRRTFIAVSPSTRDDLIARGVAPDSIRIIPNGLDHARYHDRGRVADSRPTLLVLGRVEFYKRIDLVLQAVQQLMAQLPDVQLLVVGDGHARAALERQAADLHVGDHVTFTGFVSEAEKVEHIRRAHVVVTTSEKEGWGLTVLEANGCGLPAVASDVPGLRDAVRDGDTGVLVPHGDVARLTDALLRVLRDRDYRERLSAGARRWAQEFSWDHSEAEIAGIIEAISGAVPEGATDAMALRREA